LKALLVYQNEELPSSRIRIIQMAPHLEAHGISCEVIRWPDRIGDKLALGRRAKGTDIVVLQKKLPAFLDAHLLSGAPLVFDYDDAIMFRDRPKNGSFDSRSRRIRFNRITRMSRGLIAGNRYLASFAPIDRVLIAPSPVPHEVPIKQHRETAKLRIGWVGLGKNLGALDMLRPVFAALDVTPVVISNQRYSGFPNEHVPWSLASQDELVAELDIGIMPLDADSPFTRGKCSYKLLQYFATGVPCIASPVGMNAEVIRPGENGLLASTTEEWIAAIRTMSSTEKRAAMGAAGRRDVETSYTYPVIAERWSQFLKACA